ncbi:MAG TPA: hypothetical protein VGM78_14490, partial [Ilumatobacteraceae bacterium]
PIVFELVLADRVGYIWQGRYSIPAAMGLVTLAIGASRRLGAAFVAAAAVAEVATLWATLRRYTVGTYGSWLFRGATWHPLLAPFALLAINAALVVVGSVLCCRDLAAHDVERRAGAEPLDLLRAEGVDALEVDR